MQPPVLATAAVAVWRQRLGLLIVASGALLLAGQALAPWWQHPAAQGVWASLLAGSATGLGALGLLRRRAPSAAEGAVLLQFGAGLMLAAAWGSLLVPALSMARLPAALEVLASLAAGALCMAVLDRQVQHRHVALPGGSSTAPAALLLVMGIGLHNLPEGFAVGAGFGGDASLGWATAASIAVQNVPEGLLVALSLWSAGWSRGAAAAAAWATGLIEPLGALLGVLLVGAAAWVLPLALAGAAGAMAYIVFDELLPNQAALRRLPFLGGFALMTGLVVAA